MNILEGWMKIYTAMVTNQVFAKIDIQSPTELQL